MEWFLMIVGILLIILAAIDFLWTTLWIHGGGGPITNRISGAAWSLVRKLGKNNGTLLSLAGPFLLVLSVLVWIVLFLAGWFCLFSSNEVILSNSQHDGTAGWIDRIYYVGYTFFTLGSGNWTPSGGVWKLLAIAATASGMLSITFAVTYLISVISAVNEKRAFAQDVLGMGQSSEEVLLTAWNGQDFRDLNNPLASIGSQLGKLTEQHNAFPILHYYYSQEEAKSSPLAVAVLNELLMVLDQHVPEEYQPNKVIMKQAKSAIISYVQTLDYIDVVGKTEIPPLPDLNMLKKNGLPVKENSNNMQEEEKECRKKLFGAVRFNAREWPDYAR